MKSILVSGLLFYLFGLAPLGAGNNPKFEENGAIQTGDGKSKNIQIDVKSDRFSGKSTLTLKPQGLIEKPNHYVQLAIKTEVGKSDDPLRKVTIFSELHVSSQASFLPEYGDNELHFLVDGNKLEIEYLSLGDFPLSLGSQYYIEKNHLRIRRSYSYLVFDNAFERLSKAENIEMRLGTYELKLNQQVTTNLREYARQVLEHRDRIAPGNKEPRTVAQADTAGASRKSAAQADTAGASRKSAAQTDTAGASQIEMKFWESIQNSNDPKDFEAYIKKYPNGHFVDLANNRIKSLGSSKGAPQPANAGLETPADVPSKKDEQSQSLQFKLGHQYGGIISTSYHEGTLSITPQKLQWMESGLQSDDGDNFSISCSDISAIAITLREGQPKGAPNFNDHEYIRLELTDKALNRNGRKRYSIHALDISDRETVTGAGEAIKRACPGLKIKVSKFGY